MYRSFTLMPPELNHALHTHYNIVGEIEFKDFDQDWSALNKFFDQTRKPTFDQNDRYIIVHQDTDLYIQECSVGINFRNFFHVAETLDIPFYTFLFWTNHFGIQKEIDILCQSRHILDRPTVIESFCATTHVTSNYKDFDIDIDKIELHALSMMGANRSHRFALYNAIKKFSNDKIAISIKGLKK